LKRFYSKILNFEYLDEGLQEFIDEYMYIEDVRKIYVLHRAILNLQKSVDLITLQSLEENKRKRIATNPYDFRLDATLCDYVILLVEKNNITQAEAFRFGLEKLKTSWDRDAAIRKKIAELELTLKKD